ncbi:MAG: sulfite exporter TauE/SafE family protein [Pseudomonadota bacterium]
MTPLTPQDAALKKTVRGYTIIHLLLLATAYITLVVVTAPDAETVRETWHFFPIGIFGAIVANSTGTGGGVVFVPAFSVEGIVPPQSVGMSFLIQCFGMSVGALVWLNALFVGRVVKNSDAIEPHALLGIVGIVLATGLPSLILTQLVLFERVDQGLLLTAFKLFSIVLGAVLLVVTLAKDPFAPKKIRRVPTVGDNRALVVLGIVGGAVTAFFSVGVGEFLAIYMILRGFATIAAVVCAVAVSVLYVLAGVIYHLALDTIGGPSGIGWDVVAFAIPGALIGGYLAKLFAGFLGAQRLKLFASIWIVASAAYLLLQGVLMST